MLMQDLEAWRRLYDLADRVAKVEPWRFMEEQDIFAVRDPQTDILYFVSVMGMAGDYPALAVYVGTVGYYMFQDISMEISMNPFANPMSLLFVPQIQCAFNGGKDELHPDEEGLLKALKRKYKKGHYPVFRRYDSGFYPWFVDAEQVRVMTMVMEQLLIMAPHLEQDIELLMPPDDFEEEDIDLDVLLVRMMENGEWTEKFAEIPLGEDPNITPKVNEDALQAAKALPKSKNRYELGFQTMMEPVIEEEGARPFFPIMFLLVNCDTDEIAYTEMVPPTDPEHHLWESMPSIALRAFESLGHIPRKIYIDNILMLEMLQPVADALGVKLEEVEQAERAVAALDFMNGAAMNKSLGEGNEALMQKILTLDPAILQDPVRLAEALTEDERTALMDMFSNVMGAIPDDIDYDDEA